MATKLESISNFSGNVSLVGAISTIAFGLGEPESGFSDTPATWSAYSATEIAGSISFTTGAAAAGMRAFSNHSMNSIKNFDYRKLAKAATLLLARSDGLSVSAGEILGSAAENGAALQQAVQEACK